MTTVGSYFYQQDFEKIIHDGVSFMIPPDVLQRIMELEAKMKIKATTISNHYESRSTGHKKMVRRTDGYMGPRSEGPNGPNSRSTDGSNGRSMDGQKGEEDQWSRGKVKEPAKINSVQRVLVALNKMSKTNYETQLVEIMEALQESDDMGSILKEILQVCCRTQSMSAIYADLWIHLWNHKFIKDSESESDSDESNKESYSVIQTVFEEKMAEYKESFSDIVYVDPEKDNDGFCLYTKKNTIRRATTVFITHLFLKGFTPLQEYVGYIQFMLDKVVAWVSNTVDNRRNELEEVSENLFASLSLTVESLKDSSFWEHIVALSQTVVKEHPNMTSRSKFKYQDLVKLKK